MKKSKGFLSVVLAVLMILSVMVAVPTTASAASHTQEEAVAWAKAQVGKSLDYDGAYGAQCVDLIAFYYQYLGTQTPGGNGCDYCRNALPSGWQRITNYSGYTPQPGDICVWDSNVEYQGVYGHVGIVVGGDSNRINTVEQNVDGSATINFSRNTSLVSCFIRPDFVADTQAPTVTNARVENISGSSFTLKCTLSDDVGVTRAWFVIYGPSGEKQYEAPASNGEFSHTIYTSNHGGAGTYALHMYVFDATEKSCKIEMYDISAIDDKENPVVSNVRVENVSAKSFTLKCTLSDDVGVTRAWFVIYGPSGEKQYEASASNGEFSHTIFTSDHGGAGTYALHMYVFDATEKSCKIELYDISAVDDKEKPVETEKTTVEPTQAPKVEPTETPTQVPTTKPTDVEEKPTESITIAPTQPTTDKPDNPTEPLETQPATDKPETPTEPVTNKPENPTEAPEKIDISDWNVEGLEDVVYTGKVIKPEFDVVNDAGEYAEFTEKFKNNKKVGTATVTITGIGDYTGTIVKTFNITKAKQPMTVKAVTKKASRAKLKITNVKVKPLTVKNAQGAFFCKKLTGSKFLTVSKNGVVTVKKGSYNRGTILKIKVKITAKGDSSYKSGAKTVTAKIKIK